MRVWGLPLEKTFETTILRTSENAPFNRYLLFYIYIYIHSGSAETSISIKTDTHQNYRDMNHFLANQNLKKESSTGGQNIVKYYNRRSMHENWGAVKRGPDSYSLYTRRYWQLYTGIIFMSAMFNKSILISPIFRLKKPINKIWFTSFFSNFHLSYDQTAGGNSMAYQNKVYYFEIPS